MYNPIHSPDTTEKIFFFHLAIGLVVNLDLLKGSSFDGVRNLLRVKRYRTYKVNPILHQSLYFNNETIYLRLPRLFWLLFLGNSELLRKQSK